MKKKFTSILLFVSIMRGKPAHRIQKKTIEVALIGIELQ